MAGRAFGPALTEYERVRSSDRAESAAPRARVRRRRVASSSYGSLWRAHAEEDVL
ncbi:hypothetical protein [Arthrobacter tecti]